MKPAPFDYVAPSSTADAVSVLAGDEEAKVLAGGQSLVPLLALRLARPTVVVDVNRLPLDDLVVDEAAGVLRLGTLVRHAVLERDTTVATHAPLLALAATHIGHLAIRRRGTLGGSLAHADPAAELPAALVTLRGAVVVEGPTGRRRLPATDLFEGFLATALATDELIVEVEVPLGADGATTGFAEWAPREGDFAHAGIALVVERAADGAMREVRATACGIGTTPHVLDDAVAAAAGERTVSDGLLRTVAASVARSCTEAGADGDRAELAGLLAARALVQAAA